MGVRPSLYIVLWRGKIRHGPDDMSRDLQGIKETDPENN
jgi:hypothetical protein